MRVSDLIKLLQRKDINNDSLVYLNFNQVDACVVVGIDDEQVVILTDDSEQIEDYIEKAQHNEKKNN